MHRATRNRARTIVAAIVAALASALAAAAVVALPSPAGAAGTRPYGDIHRTFQYRDGRVFVAGWVYNSRFPRSHPAVCLAVDGRCLRYLRPNQYSPGFDRAHHTSGRHRFAVTLQHLRAGAPIVLRTYGPRRMRLDAVDALSPGKRVVRVARRYVGDRYSYGGSSPRSGFDCSGYTMYSYGHGKTARLPHNAEAQRNARGMRPISRRDARPGDLVFYMSGGSAYHVAIYAGHGYQYSATDPQQGVEYDRIHARNVRFKTDWHR